MSAMGVKINQFSMPVCNSFKPKIIYDQLCYEVDPNKFLDHRTSMDSMQTGLTLLVSLNEDRQIGMKSNESEGTDSDNSISWRRKNNAHNAYIYLGTKGMFILIRYTQPEISMSYFISK